MPVIYVVILNWNGYEDTHELLVSLQKVKPQSFKIIIIDNNSTSNDVDKLAQNFGEFIETIRCESNLGFAGGNNKAINKAVKEGADYILLLNNDTIVQPDFLEPLLQIFDKDQKVGIAAPQINYFNEPNRIWSAGGKISKIRGSGFAYSDKIEVQEIIESGYRDFVSGCCMMIKKEVFETIGLFDEKFFLYVEDTDFCYRTIKAGFKIFVSTPSKIYHKIGSTAGGKFEPLPIYYVTRNRLYFAKKNFHSSYLITVSFIFFVMALKSCYWLLMGKINEIYAVLLAFFDFFRHRMGKIDHNRFKKK